ncbi:hypothetical protein [Nitrosopumilus cobalaminigenes]|nr:hypothetical protein [Nitrosopumilus cobalaminigenes]
MTRICKKCDVEMDVMSLKVKRRGNDMKNIPDEYYCPKCDHTEYEN